MLPAVAGALIGGASNLIGGLIQNKQNESRQADQNQFQDYMSSTAYQRAVADMRKAGLNPMLAYQQGGASASAGGTIAAENVLGQAATTAIDYRRMKKELEKTDSEIDVNKTMQVNQLAQAQAASATAAQANANAKLINADLPRAIEQGKIDKQLIILDNILNKGKKASDMIPKLNINLMKKKPPIGIIQN